MCARAQPPRCLDHLGDLFVVENSGSVELGRDGVKESPEAVGAYQPPIGSAAALNSAATLLLQGRFHRLRRRYRVRVSVRDPPAIFFEAKDRRNPESA